MADDREARSRLRRLARLCSDAVERLELRLQDIRVLTEAATGSFSSTAAMAAFAGADKVVAVSRDSRWGTADQAFEATEKLAGELGVGGRIHYTKAAPSDAARDCALVTNVGFLRPIDASLIANLAPESAIALMWEPWEMRTEEIDLEAAKERRIPVIGTHEAHRYVRTMDYLGPTVARLLFDAGIEIKHSKIVLVGSDPFGTAIETWLAGAGATVVRASSSDWPLAVSKGGQGTRPADALVLAEHRDRRPIVSCEHGDCLKELAERGLPIVHLCGEIDYDAVEDAGVLCIPGNRVPAGFMSVSTAYAGDRPVVDLHSAGLKVASLAIRALREGAGHDAAVAAAVESGLGLAVEYPL